VRKTNTFSLTASALLSALSFVALMAANIMPTGKIALICIAVSIQCIIVLEFGAFYGAAGSAVLSILILIFGQNKYLSAGYVLFLGAYPVLKSVFEKGTRKKEVLYKGIYFTVTSLVGAIAADIFINVPALIVMPLAVVIMVIGDYALSLVISFYIARIFPHTRKLNKK